VTNKNLPLILNESWITLSVVKGNMNMKKLNLALAILVTAVMAANAATVTSDVVGYSKISAPSGTVIIVPTFVKPNLYAGSSVVTADGFACTAFSAGARSRNVGSSYPKSYVEITSGSFEGYTFDIDSNTASKLSVVGIPQSLVGQTVTIAVRDHLTLDDFVSGQTGLVDYDSGVSIYNPNGTTSVRYFASPSWVADDFSTPAGDTVIYPGSGFTLSSGGASFTFTGMVKATKTVVPLYTGAVNIVGPLNPSNGKSITQIGIASALDPYNDGINSFSTNGQMSINTTYYSDGADILDSGFSTLVPTASDDVPVNQGFVVTVSQNRNWTYNSPLTP
jgi:hypothetical protein